MKRLAVALLLLACGGGVETAVRVRVDFDESVVVRQLRFKGESEGATVFGPAIRTGAYWGQVLSSGGELVVLLPERLVNQELECSVDGLDQSRVVAVGTGSARVLPGREVECLVVLVKPLPRACSGCLGATGECRTGVDDQECGSGGGACVRCEGEQNHCWAGRCVD